MSYQNPDPLVSIFVTLQAENDDFTVIAQLLLEMYGKTWSGEIRSSEYVVDRLHKVVVGLVFFLGFSGYPRVGHWQILRNFI